MDQQQVMRITKALADPTRFRILQTIAAAGESCCSELATRFPVTQATCSQHLKVLADAGLLQKPSPPMLLIAGAKDTQVPFEDFLLLLRNGSPKHAWVNPEGQTMGRSLTVKDDEITASVIIPWVRQRFGL